MTNANPAFPLQVACFIDHLIQMYLIDCLKVSCLADVSEANLSFVGIQQLIVDGSFSTLVQVPVILAGQLQCSHSGLN